MDRGKSFPLFFSGLNAPRLSRSGDTLPNARRVSTGSTPSNDSPSERNTHMLMQFAQFADHDTTLTPLSNIGE